jgi:quercetin dioxygenase-like cupin family protein
MSFNEGIVLGAGEGKTILVLGNPYTYKATKEETGGAYALIENTVISDGPPPHIHETEEEAFYLLEGELKILLGDRTFTAKPGDFVLVPRGIVHTFSRAGTESAKMLVIISPAGFEKFFEEIAGPPDLEKVMALAPKYNLKIVGPPSK